MDECLLAFNAKSKNFWYDVLNQICGIDSVIAKKLANNAEVMISDAIIAKYHLTGLEKEFVDAVSKFSRLQPRELDELFGMYTHRKFTEVFTIIKETPIDF